MAGRARDSSVRAKAARTDMAEACTVTGSTSGSYIGTALRMLRRPGRPSGCDNPAMPIDAAANAPREAAAVEKALLLRLARGPVPGDTLAREAGLTRAAVWKRIEALRAAG